MKLYLLIGLLTGYNFSYASIKYVRADGSGSGSSWQNASPDLQLIMNNATSGDSVFVASGTYKPQRLSYNTSIIDPDNRRNSFVVKNGIKLFGGFPSSGNPGLLERDFIAYPTVLSGNIGDTTLATDNCFHVLISVNNNSSTQLNGFVIADGYAGDFQGVTYVDTNTIEHKCGGGLVMAYSNMSVTHTVFRKNTAYRGGGLHLTNGDSLRFKSVKFYDNYAWNTSGGMLVSYAKLYMNGMDFQNNSTYGGAGGLGTYFCEYTMENSNFSGNSAGSYGGAMLDGTADINYNYLNKVTFSNNYAGNGGAIYVWSGITSLSSCLFYKNRATGTGLGGAIFSYDVTSIVKVSNSTFYGNSAWKGGSIYCTWGIRPIKNCIFWNNTAMAPDATAANDFFYGQYTIPPLPVSNSILQPFNTDLVNINNNITADPLFMDSANADFRLTCGSPAINAGNDSVYFTGQNPDISNFVTDLAGQTRINQDRVDIGAYEYQTVYYLSAKVCKNESYNYNGTTINYPYSGYVDSFINTEGCDSMVFLSVTENIIDTSITVGNASLHANAIGAVYKWIDCTDGTIVQEGIENNFSPQATGAYRVVVELNGCTDSSACYNWTTSGIKRSKQETGLSVYPNPAQGKLYILNKKGIKHSKIFIADITGKVLFVKELNANAAISDIDISSLHSGLYFIKGITESGQSAMVKFVKE